MARVLTEEDLARLRLQLMRHADLFEDPGAYAAGVEDALAAVGTIVQPERAEMRLVESGSRMP
jgi:hypothetical protein